MVVKEGYFILALLVLFLNLDGQDSLSAQKSISDKVLQTNERIQTDSFKVNKNSVVQNPGESAKRLKESQNKGIDWPGYLGALAAIAGLIYLIIQDRKKKANAKEEKTAQNEADDEHAEEKRELKERTDEERYRDCLQEELGKIRILGSPDIDHLPVKLLDAFVPPNISDTWRSETRFDSPKDFEKERSFSPEAVMKRAFEKFRMLVIIGDPGSGKTTLLKYYAITCLTKDNFTRLGFKEKPLPLYIPLRDLEPKDAEPDSLQKNLEHWATKHQLNISSEIFLEWLHNRHTLILFDGLDEVSDLQQRQRVCQWIDNCAVGLKRARFVVSSRHTGYRKLEGIELAFDHLRADVKDFSPGQQEEFLNRWFCAAYEREYNDGNLPPAQWAEAQKEKALSRAQAIIDYLRQEKTKAFAILQRFPCYCRLWRYSGKNATCFPRAGRSSIFLR